MARQEEEVKPKEALAEIKVVRTAPAGRSCILHDDDDTGLRGPGLRPPKTEGIIESLSAHPALFCV